MANAAINNIDEEEAKAGVAALLTPDAEALAAVCDSDDDDDEDGDQDLDTGDITIREGEERDFWKEGKRKERSLLASSLPQLKNPISTSKTNQGSELATYIFVDLPRDAPLPAPGSIVTIRGLETASPSIEFGGEEKEKNACSFSAEGGEWKESVGSLLFVSKQPSASAAKGAMTTTETGSPPPPPPGSYLCHTERILSFRKEG